MKNIRILRVLVVTFFIPMISDAAESDDAAVLAILKPVAEAALRGDFAAAIQVMYDPLAQDLGGKAKLAATVVGLKDQLQTQNLKLVRQEFLSPLRFIQGGQRRYVIVPTLTELQSPTGVMRAYDFQLGVEVSPGSWQFVDGTQVTRPLLNKYFSDFPAAEKLPQRRQETLPRL